MYAQLEEIEVLRRFAAQQSPAFRAAIWLFLAQLHPWPEYDSPEWKVLVRVA